MDSAQASFSGSRRYALANWELSNSQCLQSQQIWNALLHPYPTPGTPSCLHQSLWYRRAIDYSTVQLSARGRRVIEPRTQTSFTMVQDHNEEALETATTQTNSVLKLKSPCLAHFYGKKEQSNRFTYPRIPLQIRLFRENINSQLFLITDRPIDLRQRRPRADTNGPLTSISMQFAGLLEFEISQAQIIRSSGEESRIVVRIWPNLHLPGEKRQPNRFLLHLTMIMMFRSWFSEDRPISGVLSRHRLVFGLHENAARRSRRRLREQHLPPRQFRAKDRARFIALLNLDGVRPRGLQTGILIKEFPRTVPRRVTDSKMKAKNVTFMVKWMFHRNTIRR